MGMFFLFFFAILTNHNQPPIMLTELLTINFHSDYLLT